MLSKQWNWAKAKSDFLYFAVWYLGNVQSELSANCHVSMTQGELSNGISLELTRWPEVRGDSHGYVGFAACIFQRERVAVVKSLQRIRNLETISYNNHMFVSPIDKALKSQLLSMTHPLVNLKSIQCLTDVKLQISLVGERCSNEMNCHVFTCYL